MKPELYGTACREKVAVFHFTQMRTVTKFKWDQNKTEYWYKILFTCPPFCRPGKLMFEISKERRLRDNLIVLFRYLRESCCYHVETTSSSIFHEWLGLCVYWERGNLVILVSSYWHSKPSYLPNQVNIEYLGNRNKSFFHGKFQCRKQVMTLPHYIIRDSSSRDQGYDPNLLCPSGFLPQGSRVSFGRFCLPRCIEANDGALFWFLKHVGLWENFWMVRVVSYWNVLLREVLKSFS